MMFSVLFVLSYIVASTNAAGGKKSKDKGADGSPFFLNNNNIQTAVPEREFRRGLLAAMQLDNEDLLTGSTTAIDEAIGIALGTPKQKPVRYSQVKYVSDKSLRNSVKSFVSEARGRKREQGNIDDPVLAATVERIKEGEDAFTLYAEAQKEHLLKLLENDLFDSQDTLRTALLNLPNNVKQRSHNLLKAALEKLVAHRDQKEQFWLARLRQLELEGLASQGIHFWLSLKANRENYRKTKEWIENNEYDDQTRIAIIRLIRDRDFSSVNKVSEILKQIPRQLGQCSALINTLEKQQPLDADKQKFLTQITAMTPERKEFYSMMNRVTKNNEFTEDERKIIDYLYVKDKCGGLLRHLEIEKKLVAKKDEVVKELEKGLDTKGNDILAQIRELSTTLDQNDDREIISNVKLFGNHQELLKAVAGLLKQPYRRSQTGQESEDQPIMEVEKSLKSHDKELEKLDDRKREVEGYLDLLSKMNDLNLALKSQSKYQNEGRALQAALEKISNPTEMERRLSRALKDLEVGLLYEAAAMASNPIVDDARKLYEASLQKLAKE